MWNRHSSEKRGDFGLRFIAVLIAGTVTLLGSGVFIHHKVALNQLFKKFGC